MVNISEGCTGVLFTNSYNFSVDIVQMNRLANNIFKRQGGGNVRILRDRGKSEGLWAVPLDPLVFVQDEAKQTLVSAFLGGNEFHF